MAVAASGFGSAASLRSGSEAPADFFLCDIFDASPKADMATMEHPIFSLSTRPDLRILSYAHNGVKVQVTPSVRGRATIHDKDILIFCISQLVAALNAGREITRTVQLCAHDLLIATRRDTSGDSYVRLYEAFERLAGTRVTTNLMADGIETTTGFGLIEAWQINRRSKGRARDGRAGEGGRMISVLVTLSDWLFRAVLAKSVLTLNRDYFSLRKPLERRTYELARKHCGRQPEWRVSVETLHKKAGSVAPLRVFRAALRRMIQDGQMLDYTMSEQPGDLICFTRQAVIEDAAAAGGMIFLDPEVLEHARTLAPGYDIYALEAEWRSFWISTGRPRLVAPDRAFLAWLKVRLA
jgi:plasmid replication initiation protein